MEMAGEPAAVRRKSARLYRELIFRYPELPELGDRGWSYEIVPASCGDAACEDDVRLHLVRWGR